jgi:enoyl-CoA hydratase/carnithine racemase
MPEQILSLRKASHVWTVEIDGCPGCDEGIYVPLSSEMADACERIAWDEEARAVVLAFGDGWVPLVEEDPLSQRGQGTVPPLVESIAALKVPVIAAIKGDAVGLGLELAMACDIRIGTIGARFGLPAVRKGSMPSAGGTQRLPRLVGLAKAMEMILTGTLIDGEGAEAVGLLNRLTAPHEVISTAAAMAEEMASKSPLSLAYVKEALHKGMDLTLDQGMRMELDLYLLLFSTSDRVEGITAFKEKRSPRFEGA